MKKILSLFSLLLICLFFTGCIKRDTMEDINIYTSVYPIEFITSRLYGGHSTIKSIYPDGIKPDKYELTDKQIADYSKTDLFIFTELSNEKQSIYKMLKNNGKLKIIDSTLGIDYKYSPEELWLNPSNLLMIAQNIKNGFDEYLDNDYLKNEINDKYEELKIDISNVGAKLNSITDDSTNNTIIVADNGLKFLENYGFEVISLDEDGLTAKNIDLAKLLILRGKNQYIFTFQNEDLNNTVNSLVKQTSVKTVALHSLSSISENERNSKKDYISIMNDNIASLKQELYD